MALLVNKFGGTSVGSIERIEAVADIIINQHQQGHQVVAVVSAMSGETNRLLALAHQVDSQPTTRELDVLVSTGEQASAALLTMVLVRRGFAAVSLLGDQLGIQTNNQFSNARIEHIDTQRIRDELHHWRIVIAAGFQGRDREGNITTLGRGGSDTSAVAIAAAINAHECHIYTDVDGIYTTDPRIEPQAWRLACVSANHMIELASAGAKVLHLRAVEAAIQYKVPLRVLSSFKPDSGTYIDYEEQAMAQRIVTGIACKREQSLICVNNCRASIETTAVLLELMAQGGIEIDVINQVNHTLEKVDYALSIPSSELNDALALIQSCEHFKTSDVSWRDDLAMLSVVGAGIKANPALSGGVFRVLADEQINVILATTSEIKLSVLVPRKYLELGVRALHSAFLTADE